MDSSNWHWHTASLDACSYIFFFMIQIFSVIHSYPKYFNLFAIRPVQCACNRKSLTVWIDSVQGLDAALDLHNAKS